MKNTKKIFQAFFFGIFALPAFILAISAISVFTGVPFFSRFYNWVSNGWIWLLIVVEILIILITIVLWYTLRLKNIESLTVKEVVKHRKTKNPKIVEKIVITKVQGGPKKQRKELKTIEKREVVKDTPVVKKENKPVNNQTNDKKIEENKPVTPQPTTPIRTNRNKPLI